ncbi:phosphodiester glycosidase family protein [Roseovarius sp. B08]|uniref:phosphodiester glycosidase family protein n=1 Tax=Roseovarius sp. B08 TaxID=3449223 RepID=UPI003EDBF74D
MWRGVLVALVLLAGPAAAVECQQISYDGARYTTCKVDVNREKLRLFLNDPMTGKPLGSFSSVERQVRGEGGALLFAMNAGMYHQDRSPVGHYVEAGRETKSLVTREGPGNFGLLPNGVFCVQDDRVDVFETRRFEKDEPSCNFASQSGPMLVIDGQLHPRFLENSDSLYVRNGVGTSADGRTAWFVISEDRVNFHAFARVFRDVLKTPQALYFDGNISRLYAPQLGRHDGGFPMGPIVGVVAQ